MSAGYFTRMIEANALREDLFEPQDTQPAKIEGKWTCSHCHSTYSMKSSAEECCSDCEYGGSMFAYKCPACDVAHDYLEEARCCCYDSGAFTAQCMVCLGLALDTDAAVDCCMLLHPTLTGDQRQHMKQLIAAGADWLSALEQSL